MHYDQPGVGDAPEPGSPVRAGVGFPGVNVDKVVDRPSRSILFSCSKYSDPAIVDKIVDCTSRQEKSAPEFPGDFKIAVVVA